ncbi:MAG: pre-16S rRNA-processing nuclease YqgF [Microcystaceae cyanobacterium]
MLLGFDPGRDKCGIAVTDEALTLHYHQVIASDHAIATLNKLCQQYFITTLIMGNQTTSKQWKQRIERDLEQILPIILIDERNSTLEARDRYWQLFPPRGLKRLIPQGMRLPPRPIDDIVAILLIERYLRLS